MTILEPIVYALTNSRMIQPGRMRSSHCERELPYVHLNSCGCTQPLRALSATAFRNGNHYNHCFNNINRMNRCNDDGGAALSYKMI